MELLPTRIEREDCSINIFADHKGLKITGHSLHPDIPEQVISDLFHYLWYVENISTKKMVHWFGKKLIKNPFDLWIYQEIFNEVKPDLVIETGTYHGGSALYFASLLDILGKGTVITIDVEKFQEQPKHDRIQYLTGSSIDQKIIETVEKWVKVRGSVLVMLDSLHWADHVLKELNIYSKYVTKGSYIIVEDTDLGGNPITIHSGEGPGLAVKKFLRKNRDFTIDKERERFRFTCCPGGFLRRA